MASGWPAWLASRLRRSPGRSMPRDRAARGRRTRWPWRRPSGLSRLGDAWLVHGRKAEPAEPRRVEKDINPADLACRDGQYLDRVRLEPAVLGAPVSGGRGLPVGRGANHLEQARLGENGAGEEADHVVPPGEPCGHGRHLENGLVAQQPREFGDIRALKGRQIPIDEL